MGCRGSERVVPVLGGAGGPRGRMRRSLAERRVKVQTDPVRGVVRRAHGVWLGGGVADAGRCGAVFLW